MTSHDCHNLIKALKTLTTWIVYDFNWLSMPMAMLPCPYFVLNWSSYVG